MSKSTLEQQMCLQLNAARIMFKREQKVIPRRRFTVDFLIDPKVVLEVEGGIWTGGRHTRGHGYQVDCEKYNLLTLLGYKVIRVTGAHIKSGKAILWVQEAIS